jgi:DNA replication and repair protein RecF
LQHLVAYYRALKQKNAALKQQSDPTLFDSLLIEHGVGIITARQSFIAGLAGQAAVLYRQLAPASEMHLHYAPSFEYDRTASDTPGLSKEFERELLRKQSAERQRQVSLVGPHRDELVIMINDLPARTHASRGEWRTAAIAIKLGLFELLRGKRQYAPILLLDELFAELDHDRAAALVQTFGMFGQLFVTTAGRPSDILGNAGKRFHVVSGTIEQES